MVDKQARLDPPCNTKLHFSSLIPNARGNELEVSEICGRIKDPYVSKEKPHLSIKVYLQRNLCKATY